MRINDLGAVPERTDPQVLLVTDTILLMDSVELLLAAESSSSREDLLIGSITADDLLLFTSEKQAGAGALDSNAASCFAALFP